MPNRKRRFQTHRSVQRRQPQVEKLDHRQLLASLLDVFPTANSQVPSDAAEIVVAVDQPVDLASLASVDLAVHASQSGRLGTALNEGLSNGNTIVWTLASSPRPGELVEATLASGLITVSGEAVESSHVWQFRTQVNKGSGTFFEAASMANADSHEVALGDLNGDGHLDAFVVGGSGKPDQSGVSHLILLNDGNGTFADSGQRLEDGNSTSVALGDVDGDGDLDAFVTNRGTYAENTVWLNDGTGSFSFNGQYLGEAESFDVTLGDLDGDGDLDAFVANGYHGNTMSDDANRIWLNDGSGNFVDSGQLIGAVASRGVSLADVDGDGDLDVYVANYSYGGHHTGLGSDTDPARDRLWINDGHGVFQDSGLELSQSRNRDAVLADFDGDGDVDVMISGEDPTQVWLNDGSGLLSDSGKRLGHGLGHALAVGDLDGDHDLDAVVGVGLAEFSGKQPDPDTGLANVVLLNRGNGDFDVRLGLNDDERTSTLDVAVGDVTGDGGLDVYVTNRFDHQIWLNAARVIGDANGDGRFDRLDLVLVLQGGKYLTTELATWSEGDWNDDGLFDELDVIAALNAGAYQPRE